MDDFLGIYLRDQLALGVVWRELARRAHRHNRGTELGDALDRVATAIAQDVDTFHVPNDHAPGRGATQPGQDRPRHRRRAPRPAQAQRPAHRILTLSRFVELEILAMGIDGKKQLWTTLRDLAGLASRLPDIDFDHLIDRAERQRAELEPFRVAVGTKTFGTRAAR